MFRSDGMVDALERIQFQQESKLFKDLTKTFQNVMDQIQKKYGDKEVVPFEIKDTLLKDKTDEKLRKIFLKHLNLDIKTMIFTEDSHDAAVLSTMKNNDLLEKYITRIGMAEGQSPKFDGADDAADTIVKELGQTVDAKTGKHMSKSTSEVYQYRLILTAGFFKTAASYTDIHPFTAKEIAAIVLHEMGHATLMPYDAQQTFRSAHVIKDAFEYLRSDALSEDEKKNAATRVLERISKEYDVIDREHDNDNVPHKNIANAYKNASKKLKDFSLTTGSTNRIIPVILGIALIHIISSIISSFINRYTGSNVLNDEGRSNKDRTSHERTADDFSVRHGAGVYLNSALIKMQEVVRFNKDTPTKDYNTLLFRAQNAIGTALKFIFIAFGEASMAYPYENIMKRTSRILEVNLAFFKEPNVPKDIQREWIENTKELQRQVKEFQNKPYMRAHAAAVHFLEAFSIDTLTNTVIDANLRKDMDILQDATSGLIRNPLYFQSARLRNM